MSERGFASSIVLALLVLAALFALALADAANVLLAHTRARKAADAAALAAAAAQWPLTGPWGSPGEVAAAAAEENGAALEACACPLRGERAAITVSVPTRVRLLRVAPARVRGHAAASLDPARLFESADPSTPPPGSG